MQARRVALSTLAMESQPLHRMERGSRVQVPEVAELLVFSLGLGEVARIQAHRESLRRRLDQATHATSRSPVQKPELPASGSSAPGNTLGSEYWQAG